MINSRRMLVDMIQRRRLAYLGHIVRRDDSQRLLLHGKLKGNKVEVKNDSHGKRTSENGQELSTMSVLGWHKTEKDGDP